jgi:hypothetical protein
MADILRAVARGRANRDSVAIRALLDPGGSLGPVQVA